MSQACIRNVVRAPFGRFGGALAPARQDDLAAVIVGALLVRLEGLRRSVPRGKDRARTGAAGQPRERIRAAGAGIGASFTPTGAGTPLAEGKETREIDGRAGELVGLELIDGTAGS